MSKGFTTRQSPRDVHLEGLLEFLRSQHPTKTSAHVEAVSGVSAKTVEKWLQRNSAPSLSNFIDLIQGYGPRLLEACYKEAPAWISELAYNQTRAEIVERIQFLFDQLNALEAKQTKRSE